MAASKLGGLAGFATAAFNSATGAFTGKDDASADSKPKRPDVAASADKADSKTDAASDTGPVKRGRGRPPKPGGPAPKKPVVLGPDGLPRKRGRPPKEDGAEPKPKAAKKAKPTPANGATERRGRKKKEEAAPAPKKAAPKKAAPKSGRGKKEEVVEEPEDEIEDDDDEDDEDEED